MGVADRRQHLCLSTVTIVLIPTHSGRGEFRKGGLLHLPHCFPFSPCSEGGPEIEVHTPMGGWHGCCSIEVHKPAHFSPHRASSLWLSPFQQGGWRWMWMGLPHGLRTVWDRWVLEGGRRKGVLVWRQGYGATWVLCYLTTVNILIMHSIGTHLSLCIMGYYAL